MTPAFIPLYIPRKIPIEEVIMIEEQIKYEKRKKKLRIPATGNVALTKGD